MKVYAVIRSCEDGYYPEYQIVDDCVYLKEEDAKKRLEEVIKETNYWPDLYDVCGFVVKE